MRRCLGCFVNVWCSRVALAGLVLAGRLSAQEPLSHIPFCSTDSAARAFVDQVRFKVAGRVEAGSGLVPTSPDEVSLVVDDDVCISASSAFAGNGGSRGVPAPFPVAVVRAGTRYAVRLPDPPPSRGDQRTLVFDANFQPLGRY